MINEVLEQLVYLKLKSAQSYLKELHINDNISNSELKGLSKVLSKEVEAKEENNRLYNVKVAAFPYIRKLEEYDFDYQPTVNSDKIEGALASKFYEDGSNIVLIGNPGVGKTHLAVALGYEVAVQRNSVYFIKFSKLITNLKQAYTEGNLEKKLKLYYKYKLLIIDEARKQVNIYNRILKGELTWN